LPEHIKLWIDEKDLLVGDSIESSLQEAIEVHSDFVIMFLDNYALKSNWVQKELNWALSHEKEIGRTFVLPVMLEKDLELELPPEIQKRKYLFCPDFSENSVRNLSGNIISELFAWLSRDLNNKTKPINKNDGAISLLEEADIFTAKIA